MRSHQEAQCFPCFLLRVDRGAIRCQPSAAADPEAGGSGPPSPQFPTFCDLFMPRKPGRSVPPEQLLAGLVCCRRSYGIRSKAAAFGAAPLHLLIFAISLVL